MFLNPKQNITGDSDVTVLDKCSTKKATTVLILVKIRKDHISEKRVFTTNSC